MQKRLKIIELLAQANELGEVVISLCQRCQVMQQQADEAADETDTLLYLAMEKGIELAIDDIEKRQKSYYHAAELLEAELDE